VSTRLLAILFFPTGILAQLPSSEPIALNGEVRSARADDLSNMFVDLSPLAAQGSGERVAIESSGRFHFDHVVPGTYQLRVLSGPGGNPIYEQALQINPFSGPVTVDLPERLQAKPVSGLVSVRQLQHPPSKKAVKAFHEAERFSQAHDIPRAVEKLQLAIKIEPFFREAHLNLGAQYARSAHYPEAMMELQTALDIGPPDPKAYTNLAFCSFRLGQFRDAENFATKALALDPNSAAARTIFKVASKR
jgi:hypothetical protein